MHYHPAVFAAALLNSQPMGFYAPAQIVRDAREARPVDVNHSDWDNTLERVGPFHRHPRACPEGPLISFQERSKTNPVGPAAHILTVSSPGEPWALGTSPRVTVLGMINRQITAPA
jgi:hypothetical protein